MFVAIGSATGAAFEIHSGRSASAAGAALHAPKLTFGPAVPLGRDDPIRLFNSPALDRALRPNDDSLGPVECGHGCRGLAQKSRPRAFAPRSNRRLLAPAYCSK